MIRTLLFTTALAVATPALAQQTTTPGQATTPTSPTAPATAAPADPTAAGQAAQPQQATPASPANAVASIVDTEFPAYDANNDGSLDKAEFSRWMVALKDQEMKATGKSLPAEQVTAWATGAFTTADADKSTTITKPELVTYLSGGAA